MSQADFQAAHGHPTEGRGTKDSISSWLDVLTGMLAIPESQRAQVRDEFEDHLRSRIDDLLITGKPEPEAIRIAIAELGETAELAKLISKAHQHAHPRRRTMNIAMITVAIAGLSIGGLSLLTQQSQPVARSTGLTPMPALVATESNRAVPAAQDPVHTFDLPQAPMRDVLQAISDAFDLDLELSSIVRKARGGQLLGEVHGGFRGQWTLDQAIERFEEQADKSLFDFHIQLSDGTLTLQSKDEYQRSIIELQVYPTPEWVLGHSDQEAYAETIRSLLEVKFDLQYTSIKVLNGALIIAAPPKIHAQAHRIMSEVNAVIKHSEEQRLEREQAEEHEQDLRRSKLVAEIIRTRDVFRQGIEINSERRDAFRRKAHYSKQALEEFQASGNTDKELAQKLENQYDGDVRNAEMFAQEVAEDERRLEYLLGRLIESEFIYLDDVLQGRTLE